MRSDGFLCSRAQNVELFGYRDCEWGGDIEQRKSTPGYAFHLGTSVFLWKHKLKEEALYGSKSTKL